MKIEKQAVIDILENVLTYDIEIVEDIISSVNELPTSEDIMGEQLIVERIQKICEESLSPEIFEMWMKVKENLIKNRNELLGLFNPELK